MIYKNRFAGKTAVITGGASGLGLTSGQRIAEEGGNVFLWDMDGEGLEKAQKKMEAMVEETLTLLKEGRSRGSRFGLFSS